MHYSMAAICIIASAVMVAAGAVYKRIIYPQRVLLANPFAALTNATGMLAHFCRSFLTVYELYVPDVLSRAHSPRTSSTPSGPE